MAGEKEVRQTAVGYLGNPSLPPSSNSQSQAEASGGGGACSTTYSLDLEHHRHQHLLPGGTKGKQLEDLLATRQSWTWSPEESFRIEIQTDFQLSAVGNVGSLSLPACAVLMPGRCRHSLMSPGHCQPIRGDNTSQASQWERRAHCLGR